MFQYIVKRFFTGILLVIAVSILIFLLLHLMPGDPLDSLVSGHKMKQKEYENGNGDNKENPRKKTFYYVLEQFYALLSLLRWRAGSPEF